MRTNACRSKSQRQDIDGLFACHGPLFSAFVARFTVDVSLSTFETEMAVTLEVLGNEQGSKYLGCPVLYLLGTVGDKEEN